MGLSTDDLNNISASVAGTLQAVQSQGGAEPAYTPGTGAQRVGQGVRDQFWNSVNVSNLAAGATTNTTLSISADADFYWNAASYFVVTHGSATGIEESTFQIPCVTVIITDTGSSRQLMNQAIVLNTIAGDGKRPYRLTRPRLFRRTTSITFTFTSFDSTNALDIYFTLHGFKVYSIGA